MKCLLCNKNLLSFIEKEYSVYCVNENCYDPYYSIINNEIIYYYIVLDNNLSPTKRNYADPNFLTLTGNKIHNITYLQKYGEFLDVNTLLQSEYVSSNIEELLSKWEKLLPFI